MILEENWAVDPLRAGEFFAAQPGSVPTGDGFILDRCTVTLAGTEELLFGKWPVRRCVLRFEGKEEDVRAVHRRFFLEFLSAGG